MPYSYEPGFYLETNNGNGTSFPTNDNFGFHIKVRDDGNNLTYPISVDWELLLGKDALTGIPNITLSEAFSKGQLADSSDFEGPTKGTAVFTRDKRFNTIILSKNSDQKWANGATPSSYDFEEVYGVKLSNPVGANIQEGNNLAYARINQDDYIKGLYVGFESASGGNKITEGDEIELVVRSNAIADYFSETNLLVRFSLNFNTAGAPSYASEDDFAPIVDNSGLNDDHGVTKTFLEPIEVPILNGSTIKLPRSVIPLKDNKKEENEKLWLGFNLVERSTDGRRWMTANGGLHQTEIILVDSQSSNNKAEGSIKDIVLERPSSFNSSTIDTIINYNPKADGPIQIDLGSFDGATGALKIAKKSKQVTKLAKKNVDFIYDRQAGYLYFNENGKEAGFGDGGILAILEGKPKVGMGNFEFM